jgi:hypothetical protein
MSGLPGIKAEFNVANVDETEGSDCTIGTYPTPEVDPGLDLDFAYLKKYIVEWAPDLAGSTPTSVPVGPSIAAANDTIWMRGSGISGVSGLANQGHLASFELDAQKVVLWPSGDDPYYMVWVGGTDTRWGFDMTPENDNAINSEAIMYVSMP